MKFLIDKSPDEVRRKIELHPNLVAGQLCTPLTNYKNWGGSFALDNGAYSGLDRDGWFRLLKKHEPEIEQCLFCAIPDIVGNALRTDDLYFAITQDVRTHPYTRQWAYVMQDGHENRRIDFKAMAGKWMFIGGTNRFKDSAAAWDIVKTAKAIGDINIHVGRVNTPKRYETYASLGADTCDGSGVAMYDWMLDKIASFVARKPEPTLFDQGDDRDCA